MKSRILPALFVLALAGTFALPAPAQSPAPAAAPALDPDAVAALKRMGEYLRSLKTFQIQAVTTTEDVLDDGQKLQYELATDLLVQRPNHLRIKVTSDREERRFFFDGSAFTLWAPRVNFYATVPAPPTIGELVNDLANKYDIEVPLVDLFRWGTPDSAESSLTGALNAGLAVVGGASCTHYVFRQPGLDWQIWTQNGDSPLPRKLVITTLTDDARPQLVSSYTWNLAPAFNDAAFTFDPPPGSMKIDLKEIKAAQAGK
ncbi:MAG: DUF2092 domain-containing protein [Lacunisphaera sp.]